MAPPAERMTGFTLVLDGDPDAVESVWKAVTVAMSVLYREAAVKAQSEWLTESLEPSRVIPSPILPVRGEYHLRTRSLAGDDATEQRLRPPPRLS